MKIYFLIFLQFSASAAFANDNLVYDYSTPEKALTSLERAYSAKDLEAAVRSKAFYHEAREMLENQPNNAIFSEETIYETAKLIEIQYRKELIENGFPDFSNLDCRSTHKKINDTLAILTERCIFPDRGMSIQRLKAVKVNDYWKIVENIK